MDIIIIIIVYLNFKTPLGIYLPRVKKIIIIINRFV